MARRVEFINTEIAKLENAHLLHLDPGGFSTMNRSNGEEKTRNLMSLYEVIGLNAVNVSTQELARDAELFLTIAKDYSLPLISSNIVIEGTGETLFEETVSIKVQQFNVSIIGISKYVPTKWKLSSGETVVVARPEAILPGLIEKLKEDSDAIILLARHNKQELKALLKNVDGIDAAICSDGRSYSGTNEKVGNVPVSYASRQGQAVGMIQLNLSEKGITTEKNWVTRMVKTKFPENQDIKDRVDKLLMK